MRASACVGRVGGLAVALGVGAAIVTGAIGVASAAPAQDSPSDRDSASRTPAAGATRTAAGPRGPLAARTPRAAPVTAGPTARSTGSAGPAAAARPDRLADPPKIKAPLASAVVAPAVARRTGRPQAATPLAATAGATANATGANPITALLANQTPTQSATQTGQGPTGVITGTIEVDDPDSDAFTFTVATRPTHGSVQVDSTGQFVYTPDPAAAHIGVTDTFSVTVSDAPSGFHLHGLCGLINLLSFGLIGTNGHSRTQMVTVTVAPVNITPTATLTVGTPNGVTGGVTGRVIGADADGDPLSYNGSADTAKGTLVLAADGSFSYTPTAVARHAAAALGATAAQTTDSFTVTVTDTYGGSADITVTVPVSPANTAPVATGNAGSPSGSTGVVLGVITATDADADPLGYSGPAGTAKGTLVVGADGSFVYTPTAVARHAAAALGATAADLTDTVTVTVTDGHGGSTPVSVAVTIAPANTAPVGAVSVGRPDPDTGVVRGAVAAADADGDTLSVTGSTATAKGAVLIGADGTFIYTPTAEARHGAASPLATAADKTDVFTVTVSDGHGGALGLPVTVTIGAANNAPTGTVSLGGADPATGLVTGAVLGTDADGDTLSFTGSTTTAKGAVLLAPDGSFTYSPSADARHAAAALTATTVEQTDTFIVTITDGYGGTAAVPVTVAIAPANTAPIAVAGPGLPDPSTGVVTGTVAASDPDSDPLSYSGSATTAKGTVVVAADGSFTYTPDASARHGAANLSAAEADKTDAFTITVSDGHGGSVAVPVSVTIAPANAAPVATAVAGLPDPTTGLVAGALLGADADGDALSYSGSQATTKGTVVVAADGGFSYTPTALARHLAAAAGATVADTSDTFIVTVADGHGGTVAVPVTVTVSPAAVSFAFAYGSGSQYWTDPARAALESAAARLASYIVVDRPVTVSYDVLGENTAGSGWLATASVTFSSGSPGYYGTVVQTKILTGTDANGATADSRLTVNFGYPWALGDTVANNRYDFQSVVMHELVHTLGFITGFGTDPASIDRNWTSYDSFLAGADGISPIGPTYVWNPAYTPNLTGGNGGLYFAGPNAVSAYGGLVPIYTPGDWTPGSSLSHVDPAYAPPATVYLMDQSDGYGPGVRVITAVEVGILTDLGYTIHAFVFVGFGVARRRRRYAPIAARHCSRSETR